MKIAKGNVYVNDSYFMISGLLKYISVVLICGISCGLLAADVGSLEMNFLYEPPAALIDSVTDSELSELFAGIKDNSGPEIFSAKLSEFYLSGNMEYINNLSSICRGILLDSFSLYHESGMFFLDGSHGPLGEDKKKLSAVLSGIFPVYINCLENYYSFIDRYRDDDWYDRFGRNGVYQRIKNLREESEILKAAWFLYIQNTDDFQPGQVSFDAAQISNELIKLYADTSQTIYLVWWYKVNYNSGMFANPVKCYEEMISSLDQGAMPFTDSIEFLLIKNEVYLANGILSFSEALESINSLRFKLEQVQLPVKDKEELLIRLALYESYLCYNYIYENASHGQGGITPLQVGTGCYKELLRIASEYPFLSGRIIKYISYNSYYLLEQADTDQWLKYLPGWDQPVVYQAALYYKNKGPAESQKVLTLFKAIEKAGDKTVVPKMLYSRGYYFLELAENASGKDGVIDYYRNALNDFVSLLDIIDFASQEYQLGQSVLQGVLLSVRQLYDDKVSRQWLIDTLKPSVEKFINSKNMSKGISNSSDVSLLCFYYSLMLEDIKEYQKAIELFSHVSARELARAVEFHKAYCRYQVRLEADQKSDLLREVISPLESLISSSKEYDTITINAAVLLSEACLETGHFDLYLKTVSPVLQAADIDGSSELVRFAQKFVLAYMGKEFRVKVAQGDYPWLIGELYKVKPLVDAMYKKSSAEEKPLSAVLYSRLISFQISSCTDRRQLETIMSEYADILRDLGQHIAEGHLEKVRNQALQDMVSGEYGSARESWYKVRASENSDESYFYWESRYWGIYCQALNGDSGQAMHSIDVIIAENDFDSDDTAQPQFKSLWLDRIRNIVVK